MTQKKKNISETLYVFVFEWFLAQNFYYVPNKADYWKNWEWGEGYVEILRQEKNK